MRTMHPTATVTDSYGHEHQLPGPYNTIEDIEVANGAAGRHFFSANTMRFFESRIETGVIYGRLFITSEQGPDGVRKYSIRCASDDGASINTVGEFQQFATKDGARAALRALVTS